MSAQPFTIHIDDAVLSDLQQRLQRTRWPNEIAGAGWDYGTNLDYLKQLVAYWRDAYDWRAQERLLNSFPQFQATIDGFGLHFIHVKGKGPRPIPLIISHGWPGSFFEMYKIIEPLTDPVSHGGSEQDDFNIQRWSVMQAGGHFAALEQPEALVNEIRAFFKPLRQ